jgi:hypothetical protein
MPPGPKFYDPQNHVVYFSGKRLQEFADGSWITVEPKTPAFAEVVGVDGGVARSKSGDARLKVVVKLLQTSSSNADLSAIHQTDRAAFNGAGVGTFLMQDLQGKTVVQDSKAWVVAMPSSDRDRTAKSREWEFTLPYGYDTWIEGGN